LHRIPVIDQTKLKCATITYDDFKKKTKLNNCIAKHAFYVAATQIWNKLPITIKSSEIRHL